MKSGGDRASPAAGGYDAVVVGGGIVGSSIAFGLAERGLRVAVLDEGDRALRAARTNFGLIWVQSKGDGLPAYMRWTRRSADQWPAFAQRLEAMSGVRTEYRKDGGLVYCLGEADFEARRLKVAQLRAQADIYGTEMLERLALERVLPGVRLGESVSGASFCPHDGHCNPLQLLRALHAALKLAGVHYRADAPARSIVHRGSRFLVHTPQGIVEAGKVVLAAGHGIPALAGQIGLPAPIRAERGQILVTERFRPFLRLPGSGIRQTDDGTLLIGSSKEKTGLDDRTTVAVGGRMAARAIRILPELASARLNRTWGGIRILTPDNHPVYAESERCPGAFVAICHSGVTLAAAHATDFANAIADGQLGDFLNAFHPRRFDVPKAA
ncbi:MAG: FAD-dependent oxidoreductase [Betaproteobacteria bacterium]|nr:FAD-dependent oxidoreductase [Betaproteobacteria bacterium]